MNLTRLPSHFHRRAAEPPAAATLAWSLRFLNDAIKTGREVVAFYGFPSPNSGASTRGGSREPPLPMGDPPLPDPHVPGGTCGEDEPPPRT